MNKNNTKHIKVAVLNMYDGVANQGMRCIREILQQFGAYQQLDLQADEFDVRQAQAVPDLSYDIYISSGGPGNPLESKGSDWEKAYFKWLESVTRHNNDSTTTKKKFIFLICHSFQLVCRQYNIALVSKRKSTAFGVFPVHYLAGAEGEPVFEGLKDPFYAVDSRDYQLTTPNYSELNKINASLLAIEKERPHVPLERAIMAIRFNPFMIGTQFHPEADAIGMKIYLQTEEKKKVVIANHGLPKWESMIEQLGDPDKIMHTYATILPNFLKEVLKVNGII